MPQLVWITWVLLYIQMILIYLIELDCVIYDNETGKNWLTVINMDRSVNMTSKPHNYTFMNKTFLMRPSYNRKCYAKTQKISENVTVTTTMDLERSSLYLIIFYIINTNMQLLTVQITKLESNKHRKFKSHLKFTKDVSLLPGSADEIFTNSYKSGSITEDNDYEDIQIMEHDEYDRWLSFPPDMDSNSRSQEWTQDTSEEITDFSLDNLNAYSYDYSNNKMSLEEIIKLVTAIQQRLYSDCVFLLHSNNPVWKMLDKLLKLEKQLSENGMTTLLYNVRKLNYKSDRNICRQNRPIYLIFPEDTNLLQDNPNVCASIFKYVSVVIPKEKEWNLQFLPNLVFHTGLQTVQGLNKLHARHKLELQIWSGPLWLTFLDSPNIRLLAHLHIPFNSRFVAIRKHANMTLLTEIYQIGQGYPLRKNYLGIWNKEEGLSWLWSGIHYRRNNLHGLEISSAAIDFPPRMSVQTEGNKIIVRGYFGILWSILQHHLNFTMNYSVPEMNSWGWKTNNGSWTGMIGMIQRGDVHMGACAIFLTEARAEVVDFTMPLLDFGYSSLFIKKPNPFRMSWNSLINPFTFEMWWMSGVSMLIIAVFLWFLQLCNKSKQHKHRGTIADILFFVTGIFFQQGGELYDTSISVRIVILTASFMAITLHAGYSATLLSFLATDTDEMPFNSLYDLLEFGNYKFGCLKESAEYFFLRDSKDPILHRAFVERMSDELPNTNEEGMQMICNSSFAFLAPVENFKPSLKNATCNIYAVKQNAFKMHLAIPIIKNSPYRRLFDHSIRNLRSNGVLLKLWREAWPQEIPTIDENWDSVSLKETVFATTVIIMGAAISIILLLLEKLFSRLITKQNNIKSLRRRKKLPVKKKLLPQTEFIFLH